ncbi:MAG: type VI secretion system tip protein VgrG [Myxococcales bacterium]|nr:type VI secretion system tip protein VgrG [Myxococcales bacterium]
MSLSLSLNLDLDLGLGLGSKGAQRMFALRLGVLGPTDLSVVSFKGRERLSEPFRYDVVFATSAPETVVMSSLAHPASLALAVPGGTPRLVQGLAASITILGPAVHDRSSDQRRYRVRIVPRLWLLKHRRRNRVFQDKTVVQIARRLLDQAGIHHEFRVDPDDHAPYPFCYQRDETDHAFLQRILATAGIWYCFEHASGTLDALLPSFGGEIAGVGALAGGLAAVSGAVSLSASIEGVEEPLGISSKLVLLDDPLRSPVVTAGGGDLVAGLVGKGMQALGSVVADATGGLVDLGGPPAAAIPFDAEQRLAAHEERVGSFSLGKRVRPKTVRIHERLVSAHRNKVGLAEKDVVDLSVSASLDVGSVLGGGNVLDALHVKANLDVDLVPTPEMVRVDEYSEDPPLQRHPFERAGHDIRYAKRSLEQLRRDAMTGEGTSDSRRLAAGYRFRLEGHPVEAVDREYTVTSLDAEGLDPNELGDVLPEFLYRNRFEVVPVTVRPRPEKPRRAPRLGLEVAQVVSPPGQDIYCDALGRVCVRFRWLVDDQGHAPSPTTMTDEDSTCWLPVAQPWAGPGYGAQFIPRVGTEVLVGFLGGHGERPVVVGALHTEENPVPWSMPGANTKTGIRSRSTPKGEGWSEISIDDEKGQELVLVRAELDQAVVAVRDQATNTGRDLVSAAGRDHSTSAVRNQSLTAGQNHTLSVGEDLAVRVGGKAQDVVQGGRVIVTQGSQRSCRAVPKSVC